MEQIKRFPGWGSAQVALLVGFAQNKGLTLDAILSGSDITEHSLQFRDPSLAQELVVINNLLRALDDHPFLLGLKIGRMANTHTFGLMGQALIASPTLKDITSLVKQHFAGEHHFLKIQPKFKGNKILTTFDVPNYLNERQAQFILGRDMGASISFQEGAHSGFMKILPIVEVGFISKELPGMDEIADYYSCEMLFEQPKNYLLTRIAVQNIFFPLGNKFLSSMLNEKLQHFLNNDVRQASAGVGMRERIKQALEEQGYLDMSREQMSDYLNVSSRTLSRYLKSEGTTWRNLYSSLRMEKARNVLIHTNKSIEIVAENVGFASASAFSNAFSRQHGQSPWEFRQSNKQVCLHY